jgi:hypothetical protein
MSSKDAWLSGADKCLKNKTAERSAAQRDTSQHSAA